MSKSLCKAMIGIAALVLIFLLGLNASAEAEQTRKAPSSATTASDSQALKLLDRGELAAAAGDFAQAEALWQQALQAKPGWEAAQQRLADLPGRRRAFPQEQAERKRRVKARLDYVEGVAAFNAGDFARAAALFQGACEAINDDARMREHLDLARKREKSARYGSLRVMCAQKAAVLLDGKSMGETPLDLPEVPVGSHRLGLEAYGGRTDQEIQIKPMSRTQLAMQVLGGRVVVACPSGAEVLFDGKSMGRGPMELWNLPLGPHVLEVRCPGQRPQIREVVLQAGKRPEIDFNAAQ